MTWPKRSSDARIATASGTPDPLPHFSDPLAGFSGSMFTDDWPSPDFRAWMERHMPKDELGPIEPMTDERYREINTLTFDSRPLRGAATMEEACRVGLDYQHALQECIEEIDRLRSLADDDTALLDWASTNFGDHSLTIRDAIEDEGYSLRDALRAARDGTLADELYGDDDEDA